VRMVVIYDKCPNGAAPGISDVFQTVADSPAGVTMDYIECPMELKNRRRFKMLMDKCYTIGNVWDTDDAGAITVKVGSGSPPVRYINKFIKLKGKTTVYGSTSATIGATNEGAIYVWVCTNVYGPADGDGASESCGLHGMVRLRYTG